MNDSAMTGPSHEGPESEESATLERLLWRRLEGDLSREEERVLQETLAADPEAGALEGQVSALHTMLGEVEDVDAPEGLTERVQWLLRRKASQPEVEVAPAAQSGRWFVPLAAAALISAIGLVVLMGRSPSGPTNDQVAGTAVADRVPPEAQSIGSFALEEGGQLELTSTRSALRLTLDWRTGEAPVVVRVEGDGVSAVPGQPDVRTNPGGGRLELDVAAGQRGEMEVDIEQASQGLMVRIARGERVMFERLLSREEITPGSD